MSARPHNQGAPAPPEDQIGNAEPYIPFADDQHPATHPNEPGEDPFFPGPQAFPRHNRVPALPTESRSGGPPNRAEPSPPISASLGMPHHAADADVAAELDLLRQIRDATLGGAADLAITENAPPSITEVPYPVPGSRRWLVPRVAVGGEAQVGSAAWASLLPANPARIGGTIVNFGAVAVILALAAPEAVGPVTARIYLAAEGGSWDMRLANLLWAGSVSAKALAEAGTSVVTVEV